MTLKIYYNVSLTMETIEMCSFCYNTAKIINIIKNINKIEIIK